MPSLSIQWSINSPRMMPVLSMAMTLVRLITLGFLSNISWRVGLEKVVEDIFKLSSQNT